MYIQIISVNKKSENDNISQQSDELRSRLSGYGYSLMSVRKSLLASKAINRTLDSLAKSDEKPDVVIIANALKTKDSKSFKRYFVETVVAAERAENEPAPKNYWKKRKKAVREAKKENKSKEEIAELEKSLELTRKKSKVFPLGDFGNDYKGYCFMYRGMKVAAIPKAELTGRELSEVTALAAKRTTEVFENSANDYRDGFTEISYVPPKTGFVNSYIPLPGDGMAEIGRKIMVILAFLIFLAALGVLLYNTLFQSVRNAQLNGEIQKIAHGEDIEEAKSSDEKGGINWDKLKDINEEIVGWIQINDTVIDYPVLWHKGDDRYSQYYLSRNYKGGYDSFGSIFVDYRCSKGTESKNVVLHGHHMNDGSMFGNLMNYGGTTGNLDFYKKAPTIEFDTPERDGTYKIISVFKTNTLSYHGEFFNYMIGDFQNEKDFMNYVYNVKIRSLIDTGVDVNEDDELLTLSTCSYEYTNFRTVVVARRTRKGESTEVDTSKARLNENPVWPEVYYSSRGGTRPEVTDFVTAYEAGEIDWYNGDYDFKSQKVKSADGSDSKKSSDKSSDNKSSQKSTQSANQRTTTQPATQEKIYLTVTFINYDESVISTQKVEYGKAATAPPDPEKPSDEWYDYKFTGWGLDFSEVKSNMTVAPIFEAVLKPEYAQEG